MLKSSGETVDVPGDGRDSMFGLRRHKDKARDKRDTAAGELPLVLDDLMRPYDVVAARLPSQKRKLEETFTDSEPPV
jgi:hypothetical protein